MMNIFPLEQLLLIFEINLINQEINFKNHSNTVILCKLEKNSVKYAHVPLDFISLYLYYFVCAQFCNEIER